MGADLFESEVSIIASRPKVQYLLLEQVLKELTCSLCFRGILDFGQYQLAPVLLTTTIFFGGLLLGIRSTALLILVICEAIFHRFHLGSIALSAVGMLPIVGM